jgi:hypothetical protein
VTYYTGMRSEPRYPPFYGAGDPYAEGPGSPTQGRSNLRHDMPRGSQGSIATAPDIRVRGLGATPLEGTLAPVAYTLASLAGAAVGGALIGYIASEKREGAVRGAVFASGLAAVSDAMLFFTTQRMASGMALGALGIGGVGWAIYQVMGKR